MLLLPLLEIGTITVDDEEEEGLRFVVPMCLPLFCCTRRTTLLKRFNADFLVTTPLWLPVILLLRLIGIFLTDDGGGDELRDSRYFFSNCLTSGARYVSPELQINVSSFSN